MPSEDPLFKAAAKASLLAGPLFLVLLLMLQYQASAPAPLAFGSEELIGAVAGFAALLMLSSLVGAMLAFPTCLIMGGFLLFVANRVPLARPLVLWVVVGAGTALAITQLLFNSTGSVWALAFAGTAMACAGLVRLRFHWD